MPCKYSNFYEYATPALQTENHCCRNKAGTSNNSQLPLFCVSFVPAAIVCKLQACNLTTARKLFGSVARDGIKRWPGTNDPYLFVLAVTLIFLSQKQSNCCSPGKYYKNFPRASDARISYTAVLD